MAKKRKLKIASHKGTNFELQLTALIDTLVILLLFMLKTVSMDSLEIDQAGNLQLPEVKDGVSSGSGPMLSVNSEGIRWNGEKYISYVNFDPEDKNSQTQGPNWIQLNSAIAETAKTEKETKQFSGKIFLEADKSTPYTVLSLALRTARAHGYKDVRFVGAKYN